MLILGIESAAKVAGAALYENGRIIAEQMVNGALTHSETLMPMIEAVFKAAGRRPEDLDYIALTSGPGSFTGLRIGAATAKGMAQQISRFFQLVFIVIPPCAHYIQKNKSSPSKSVA